LGGNKNFCKTLKLRYFVVLISFISLLSCITPHALTKGTMERDAVSVPKLIITSLSKAPSYLLSRSKGPQIRCLISIGEVGEKRPSGSRRPPYRLRLEFEDVVTELEGGSHARREDIERLVRFAEVIRSVGGTTLIHCQAGISRSTAAAYIVLAAILSPGCEREALEATFAAAPHAHPNRLMVRVADEILSRDGILVRQLNDF
jgi:predicted protein tyrosine phosphatase